MPALRRLAHALSKSIVQFVSQSLPSSENACAQRAESALCRVQTNWTSTSRPSSLSRPRNSPRSPSKPPTTGGVWYLVARQGRELRTFKLSGIQHLERLPAQFVRPRKFDLAEYWARATQRFEEGVYRGVATLRVSPAGLAGVRRFSAFVAQAADGSAGRADARGWRSVTIPIESVENAVREMLKLGTEVEALEPAALRDGLRHAAQRLLALYAS